MYSKLLLAISLSATSLTAVSSSLFDVPLAKKCYAISQEIGKIKEVQTINACIDKLFYAKNESEDAAFKIAEDDKHSSENHLQHAINALRHAQVLNCVNEQKIIETELALSDIKSQLTQK